MPIDKTILPAKINAFVAGKLAGKTPATALPVYSSQNPQANEFIRNPACWLNGVKNISCFSPAQLSGSNWWQRGGTLITRKHALFAAHFVTSVIAGGTPLIFVDENNNVIRRNITQYAFVPWTDVAIALLDSEVPANIQVAKVLPKNYTDYLDFSPASAVYCVGLDQQEKALVKICNSNAWNSTVYNGQTIVYQAFIVNESWAGHQYQTFNEPIVVGDSGNPVFLVLDNELVLTAAWWFASSGPFISSAPVYDAANAAIESLSPGGGYALIDVNLAQVYANMQKLYFNSAGSGNFTTLTNWYQDAAFTVPAQALPASADIPVLPWAGSAARALGVAGGLAVL